jgi:hypothetical protein
MSGMRTGRKTISGTDIEEALISLTEGLAINILMLKANKTFLMDPFTKEEIDQVLVVQRALLVRLWVRGSLKSRPSIRATAIKCWERII